METSTETVTSGESAVTVEPTSNEGQVASASPASSDSGQSASNLSASGQADSSSAPPINEWKKKYDDLQKGFTKHQMTMRQLESRFQKHGGPDKAAQFLELLHNDPKFREFAASRANPNNDSQYDEETRKALAIVRREAEQIADQRLKQQMAQFQNQYTPVLQKFQEDKKNAIYSEMDKAIDGWRDYQPQVDAIIQALPPQQQFNLNAGVVKQIIAMAIAPDLTKFGAKVYEKQLQQKKTMSTQTPVTAPATQSPKPSTMAEAFKMAKRELGV